MRQIGLDIELTEKELQACASRYHFTEENTGQLHNVYLSMQLLLQCSAEYEMTEEDNRAICAVTLGRWIDELQDIYERAGKVMAAYMAECLAMEMLAKAYEQTAAILHRETGLWVSGYIFFGDGLTLEQMAEAIKSHGIKSVQCNGVYGLVPQKSVVYMAQLTHVRQESTCVVCDGCKNTDCQNRQVHTAATYGMERIFGGNTCRD